MKSNRREGKWFKESVLGFNFL